MLQTRRTRPPRFAGVAALLALAAALAAPCAAAELVVAGPITSRTLPLDVAEAHGFFAAEGLAVRRLDCRSGPRCMKELLAGRAQLATVSELPVMFASFERAEPVVIATLSTSTDNIRLLARRSAGIGSPRQLPGKRIGVIVGSGAHYFLDMFLLFQGIDPKQVTLVPLLAEDAKAAFEQNRVDVFAGYWQALLPAVDWLGADGVQLTDSHLFTESAHLVTDRHALLERAGDIARLLRAVDRAQRFIAEQPERAIALLQERQKLDPNVARTLFRSTGYRLGLDPSLSTAMESEARWALREGHVPAGRPLPNYLDFIDSGPLRAAVPALFPK